MDDEKKKKSMFSNPPLTPEQKEKLAQKLIAGAGKVPGEEEVHKNRAITIRIPDQYHRDIEKIHRKTGLTRNAVCIELLRVAIRQKLKELELE